MTAELRTGPDRGRPPMARKLAANSTAQLVTFAFRAAAGVGVVVLLARDGGPLALGIVQFALTLSGLLPFYYGVPTLLAREVARRPEEGRRWVEAGTLLALLLGAAFTASPAGRGAGGGGRPGDGRGARRRVARDGLRRRGAGPVLGVLGLGAVGARDPGHRRPGDGVPRGHRRRALAGRGPGRSRSPSSRPRARSVPAGGGCSSAITSADCRFPGPGAAPCGRRPGSARRSPSATR